MTEREESSYVQAEEPSPFQMVVWHQPRGAEVNTLLDLDVLDLLEEEEVYP